MNSTPTLRTKSCPAFLRLVFGVMIALSVLFVMLVIGVASCFWLSSDTRALRNGLIKSSGAEWRQKIALNVGGVTMGLARAGLSLVPLDENARAALRCVRGVEVGIYEVSGAAETPDRAAMLVAADKAMTARGWERVVGVMAERELVAVYVPKKNTNAQRLNCCVLVFEGRQIVLASARTNPQPLVECLLNQSALQSKMPWLAQR